jgi:type II secretory pathway component PulF
MPTFEYQAQKSTGEVVTGTVFGLSLDHAARDLAAQGMQVQRIGIAANPADPLAAVPVAPAAPQATVARPEAPRVQEVPAAATRPTETVDHEQRSYMETSVWGPLVGQVPLTNLLFFFRQGANMLQAGVPIVQSLDTLTRQTRHPKLAQILQEVKGNVEQGHPMSAGMQRYPEVFSPIVMSLMRAGEKGGFLDSAMGQIADYLEREIALRNLYKRITFYPKLQIAASIVIILGANLIIGSLNANAKQLSSPLTEPRTWICLGPLIVAIFLFLRVGLANPRVKFNWDVLAASLPGLGKIMRELAMARFGRAFGALYKGGVPVTESMKISADACGNEYLRSMMYPAVRRLETGAGLAETLRDTNAFSPIVLDMISTGETTGSVDHMLNKMAEFYEDEGATKSSQLAYIVGTVLGLCVAIYIGYIVISFYTGNYAPGINEAVNAN